MIITIDGPSGTGKTTVARKVAERLHFVYFDTGAMYRAFTWFVQELAIDIDDRAGVERALKAFDYKIVEQDSKKHYFVGPSDVTEAIRSKKVTDFVSPVSALPLVRRVLLDLQRDFAKSQNAVFEGRDLGTVVFPEAEVKIFLSADPKIRAERRLSEILAKNPSEQANHEQMLSDLLRRDDHDSTREIAPLRCPPGALQIDTTHLSIDQVVDQIVTHVDKRYPRRS